MGSKKLSGTELLMRGLILVNVVFWGFLIYQYFFQPKGEELYTQDIQVSEPAVPEDILFDEEPSGEDLAEEVVSLDEETEVTPEIASVPKTEEFPVDESPQPQAFIEELPSEEVSEQEAGRQPLVFEKKEIGFTFEENPEEFKKIVSQEFEDIFQKLKTEMEPELVGANEDRKTIIIFPLAKKKVLDVFGIEEDVFTEAAWDKIKYMIDRAIMDERGNLYREIVKQGLGEEESNNIAHEKAVRNISEQFGITEDGIRDALNAVYTALLKKAADSYYSILEDLEREGMGPQKRKKEAKERVMKKFNIMEEEVDQAIARYSKDK